MSNKPPRIVVPGLNRGAGTPRGYILGNRYGGGKNRPVEMLDLNQLQHFGLAPQANVTQGDSITASTAHSETQSLSTSVSTSLSQISSSLSSTNSTVTSLSTAISSVDSGQTVSLSQISSSLSGAISSTSSLSSAVSTVISGSISTVNSRIDSLSTAGGGGGGGGTVTMLGFGLDGQDGEHAMPIPGTPGAAGAAGSTGATGATGPQGPIGFGMDGQDGDEGMPIPGPPGTAGPSSWTLIEEYVADGTTGTHTFSAIPGTYRSLHLAWTARSSISGTSDSIALTFNGDNNSNYDREFFGGAASVASAGEALAGTSALIANIAGNTAASGDAGSGVADIPYYADTTFHKLGTSTYSFVVGTSSGSMLIRMIGIHWRSTAAITSITLALQGASADYMSGSKIALYGVS